MEGNERNFTRKQPARTLRRPGAGFRPAADAVIGDGPVDDLGTGARHVAAHAVVRRSRGQANGQGLTAVLLRMAGQATAPIILDSLRRLGQAVRIMARDAAKAAPALPKAPADVDLLGVAAG